MKIEYLHLRTLLSVSSFTMFLEKRSRKVGGDLIVSFFLKWPINEQK